jgi:hypothetical protein
MTSSMASKSPKEETAGDSLSSVVFPCPQEAQAEYQSFRVPSRTADITYRVPLHRAARNASSLRPTDRDWLSSS